jgi:hypothetical protein
MHVRGLSGKSGRGWGEGVKKYLSTHPNGDPLTPLPQASVSPPEPKGGHTRLRVRGWGGPNLDDLASMARVYFRMKYKFYKRRKL